ncbi:MAG: prepilin-type N-terminal cleavage/methylation domain-containing protein, partial [Planctomycetota bacterium]
MAHLSPPAIPYGRASLAETAKKHHRAFTLRELLVTIVVIAFLVGVPITLFVMQHAKGRHHSRQYNCAACVSGIHQGMVLFADANKDQYPLPSLLDTANATINAPASSKDTTANIISTLIYANFFGPEICVCMGEKSSS